MECIAPDDGVMDVGTSWGDVNDYERPWVEY
jgi:hypothetical protein